MEEELVFTETGPVSNLTSHHQAGDGTIFYDTFTKDGNRLYVIWEGKEIAVELPATSYYFTDPVGKGLLVFCQDDMIRNLEFIAPDSIHVTCIKPSGELNRRGWCRRKLDYDTDDFYVFRVQDDPWERGILSDLSFNARQCSMVLGLHRNKIIYYVVDSICRAPTDTPSVFETTRNTIVVELPYGEADFWFVRDSSRFLYFNTGPFLYTLDTDRNEFLRTLKIAINDINIIGIHNGIITIISKYEPPWCFMTAKLPDSHFERENDVVEKLNAQAGNNRNSDLAQSGDESEHSEDDVYEMNRQLAEELERKHSQNDALQNTMNRTVNELLNRIAQLTEEKDNMKAINDEMEISIVEVFEENKELKRILEDSAERETNEGVHLENNKRTELLGNDYFAELLKAGWEHRKINANEARVTQLNKRRTGALNNSKKQMSSSAARFLHPLNEIALQKPVECTIEQQDHIMNFCEFDVESYYMKRNTLNEVRSSIFSYIGARKFSRPPAQIVFKCFMKATLQTALENTESHYGHVLAYCLLEKAQKKDVKGREEILLGVTECCREIVMQQQWIEWPEIWDTIAEVLVNAHLAAENLFYGARPTLSDFKYAFFAAAIDPRRPYILFVQVLKRTVEMLYQNDKTNFKDAASQLLGNCKCIIEHMDTEKLTNALSNSTTEFGDNLLAILGRKVIKEMR